ncbi:ATP-binding cassette domain-containing protein [candidate division KSB1 bacterium]|nr:ATP-binding cassette domain-containing protein [candidate division KSB1 bacterium]
MHVELKNISKSYTGNLVLNKVTMNVKPGQVHALIGENGAGKSTLMKILIGVETADHGDIFVNRKNKKWRTPHDARDAGIAMVFQELSLIPTLSVIENVFLGRLLRKQSGLLDWHEMKSQVEKIFEEIEFPLDAEQTVEELSIAQKQMVEIARALSQNARLIILDEPTSPLAERDAERLFKRIKKLSEKNVSIIYITHRLEQVFKIAHLITILRDGEFIRTCPVSDVDMQTVVRDMVGRELSEQFPDRTQKVNGSSKKAALRVEGATRSNEFNNVNFSVYNGEILGIAGLVGAGRTELAEAIFGVRRLDQGMVTVQGKIAKINSPAAAVKTGIGLIADDRKLKGLVPDASVHFNLNVATQRKFATRCGWRLQGQEIEASKRLIDGLQIKLQSLQQNAAGLSGGNQQKVAIGKTLNTDSSILIFDEPTRGIDVGAKREIYFLLRKLADEGAAIILVSSELEEILGLSDRIIVMCQGRITGEIVAANATQEKIMEMAVGIYESTKNGVTA